MKKFGIIILCIVLGLMLVSCGGEGTNPENETESGVESESESESESAVETEPQGPVETMALESPR